MEEIQIRRSRAGALVTLGVGVAGLAAWLLVDFLRTPFIAFLMVMTILVGLVALIEIDDGRLRSPMGANDFPSRWIGSRPDEVGLPRGG